MAHVKALAEPRGVGGTLRPDAWWLQPLLTFLGLSAFVIYSTWAALQGTHYYYGPYLSPMYSPELFGESHHAWFGPKPAWWPAWLLFSPAILILWAPGGFRVTCYYYRGAYYKAFWLDPPQCGVGEPRKSYWGENSFPLIIQNIHRYFLYLALVFIIILAIDAWKGFWFPTEGGAARFGIGVGSLVLVMNVILLGGYTFSCHSLRHLVGGGIDRLSEAPLQCATYGCVTSLNKRHMLFAWLSLFWVGFTDVYVRLCSMGIWTDWRFI